MKQMNTKRGQVIFFAAAFFLACAAQTLTLAQSAPRKFKEGDTIEMGGGVKYEIVECRIKPNTRVEECDYLVFFADGSAGSVRTETVFELRRYQQQNEAEKNRLDIINRRNQSRNNQPKPPVEDAPEPTAEIVVPPTEIPGGDVEITVTAQQLYNEYSNNDIAATRKYVGKTVRVTNAFVFTISSNVFSARITKNFLGSTIQCYVEDIEQLATINKGEMLTLVGIPLGSLTSTGVVFEPCRIERKTADSPVKAAVKTPVKKAANGGGKLVGTWYYTAIIGADGTEKKLSNRESYLWLKPDGSYEHRFGASYGQIGNYAAAAARLTLNREDGDKKSYTVTLSGDALTLKNASGGYRLERDTAAQ